MHWQITQPDECWYLAGQEFKLNRFWEQNLSLHNVRSALIMQFCVFILVLLSPLKCVMPAGSGCSDHFCFSLGIAAAFVRHADKIGLSLFNMQLALVANG